MSRLSRPIIPCSFEGATRAGCGGLRVATKVASHVARIHQSWEYPQERTCTGIQRNLIWREVAPVRRAREFEILFLTQVLQDPLPVNLIGLSITLFREARAEA